MSDGFVALCDALRNVGIDCVFGIPGTQNVSLFDAFRRRRLRCVLSTHELAAAFMAVGYGRATGKVAALATIPGPGFTYALAGLAAAPLGGVGVVYLVGKPATQPGRRFQLQAIDQRAIAGPLVKACLSLDSVGDIDSVIREAHDLAATGEPGPVMVELDMDALSSDAPSSNARASSADSSPRASRQSSNTALNESADPIISGRANISPADFFAWMSRTLPRDAIVVTDCDLPQVLAERHADVTSPRSLISPGDFDVAGFCLPAAIGAKIGDPRRVVVALIGDREIMMSGLELLTARREGAPFATIVFNDANLQAVRAARGGEGGSVERNYRLFAKALGIDYIKFIEYPSPVIERALVAGKPVLIEVPMVDSPVA